MMVQCDMLAYRKAGENLQLAFPYSIHTPSLTASLKKVIAHFLPDLKICTSRACCSDHQVQGGTALYVANKCVLRAF